MQVGASHAHARREYRRAQHIVCYTHMAVAGNEGRPATIGIGNFEGTGTGAIVTRYERRDWVDDEGYLQDVVDWNENGQHFIHTVNVGIEVGRFTKDEHVLSRGVVCSHTFNPGEDPSEESEHFPRLQVRIAGEPVLRDAYYNWEHARIIDPEECDAGSCKCLQHQLLQYAPTIQLLATFQSWASAAGYSVSYRNPLAAVYP